jgi:hypothetical protein
LRPLVWRRTIHTDKRLASPNRFFNGENFFDMFSDVNGGSLTVSASFGTRNWLTVSGTLPPPRSFAHWHALPAVTPIALFCLFAAGVAWAFQRKELR